MSVFDNPDQLRQLEELLNPRRTRGGIECSSSSEDEGESLVVHKQTPGSIGPQAAGAASKSGGKKKPNLVATPLEEPPKSQPATLEEWQDAQEREDADILETRKCPEYTMTYRQAVGTEDVFLQMGQRTGASASCEDLVLEIALPDEQMDADKMTLTLHEKEVDLGTALYRLKLPLPHSVDVDRCQAKYDKELGKLRLTLRLRRELDYVNF
ncbi:dynein axonemal assembly factor 6 [Drosophila grimshawi]|uniref:GH14755 n=1 Tax=Drosophila grimshawi TaxID=7222 RepID=B4IWS6_DROGR|nr:dynein axonemal assembly factor 6 [Drosophila grimshawi]EDV97327.1 GH14755 [Drosophila grimshawi]